VKKCPECGNPSYDGAPICGNCGYKFPKPKIVAPKKEDIFKKEPKVEKPSDNESTVSIIKDKKLIIGAIILITLIVICGILITGTNTNGNNSSKSPISTGNDLIEFDQGDFSFKYPSSWKEVNGTDEDHPGAKFFDNKNKAIIEYYNITSSSSTLKDINQQRITHAQENGDYVELVETVTLDGRNASNIILENADGDYTRYVSMFSDGKLYVFKITGDSVNTITADDIAQTINSADIA
jgi:hypothetical protein